MLCSRRLHLSIKVNKSNDIMTLSKVSYMAKRETGLHVHVKSTRSHKTVKRLAAKKVMLANKTDKKKSVIKNSK